jgi:hypothetical protein
MQLNSVHACQVMGDAFQKVFRSQANGGSAGPSPLSCILQGSHAVLSMANNNQLCGTLVEKNPWTAADMPHIFLPVARPLLPRM